MEHNPIIDAMLNRKSVRKYKKRVPSKKTIETIVRAGQQAPFAGQLGSLILRRDRENIAYNAPISFIFLIDLHRMEVVMRKRKWKMITNDLFMLLFGAQDATLIGENMVMAAESLGLGSCYIGMIPYFAKQIVKKHKLPKRVFPLVELVMGYPDEEKPPRPRYPLDFALFENEYPKFTDKQIAAAMKVMDEGYLAQDYYRNPDIMINLMRGRKETFDYDTYSWTEHISRKWGQWDEQIKPLLRQFKACGFNLEIK